MSVVQSPREYHRSRGNADKAPRAQRKRLGCAVHKLYSRSGSALFGTRAYREQREHKERNRSIAGPRTYLHGAVGEIPLRWCYVARSAAMTLLRS